MKRALLITLFCVAALSCLGQTRAEILRAKLLDPSDKTVFVAAHRGAWRVAPENSIESIEKAIEMGVDIVEIDVQQTIGGQLILNHNPVIFRPKGAPTLEEALLAAKGRVLLNLDKAFRYFDQVMEVAERTGTVEQIIIKNSRNAHKVIPILGSYRERVIFMPIINLNQSGAAAKIEGYFQSLDPPVFELTFSSDTNPVLQIALARLKGSKRLWYNTLWPSLCGGHDDALSEKDPVGGFGWLIDNAGAGAFQTDDPELLMEYLKSR
jgi:glycerophosphoryl diester phosphodiesterase